MKVDELHLVITCALYDYKADEDDEVSFNTGDRMEILKVIDDGWFLARNLESGQKGSIPSNYVAPFEGMVEVSYFDMISLIEHSEPFNFRGNFSESKRIELTRMEE